MSNRYAIVTGSSSGIGREVALLLASDGWNLVLAARRLAVLTELATLCEAAGSPRAVPVECDVSQPTQCDRLADATPQDSLLALVNSAGVGFFGPLPEMAVTDILTQVETNLLGTIFSTRAVLPKMLTYGRGDIVNVLSIAATTVLPDAAVYSASKAGVLAFARSLALTVRNQGVRIVSVIPGATDTPMWEGGGFVPPREDMLPALAVAEAIRDVISLPRDRTIEEIVITPPKGIL